MTAEMSGGQTPPSATSMPEPGAPTQAPARRLHRSRTDRMLAGVCGGIAETYGGDPTAMRLLAVVIGIFTGIFPMLVAYLVAAVVVPEGAPGEVLPQVRHDRPASTGRFGLITGAILIVVGLAALASEVFQIDSAVVWPLALVGFGAVIVVAAGRR